MNRPFSRRAQGVATVSVGAVALVSGVLVELFDHNLGGSLAWRTPGLIVIGVIAIVVGVLRLRGKITH